MATASELQRADAGDAPRILQAFLGRAFPGREVGLDDDIFDLGFGNSLFAMELVDFIEQRFALRIEDDDLVMDNFRSIRSLVSLIEGRTRPRAS
jgi:acyl carrier protein